MKCLTRRELIAYMLGGATAVAGFQAMWVIDKRPIRHEDARRWKKNSLETAIEMNVFDPPYLQPLWNVEIGIGQKGPERDWWGYFEQRPRPHVQIFPYNRASRLPACLFEVYNQSWMDHEIIGHGYLNNFKGSSPEDEAREIQKNMTKFRAVDSLLWKTMAAAIPLYHWKYDIVHEYLKK